MDSVIHFIPLYHPTDLDSPIYCDITKKRLHSKLDNDIMGTFNKLQLWQLIRASFKNNNDNTAEFLIKIYYQYFVSKDYDSVYLESCISK